MFRDCEHSKAVKAYSTTHRKYRRVLMPFKTPPRVRLKMQLMEILSPTSDPKIEELSPVVVLIVKG
jgi:hypothetical protein